jgi:hypothetical protein
MALLWKFFWNDIKIPLVKCLNESLDNGKFSVSQRQGLITCIPKEGIFCKTIEVLTESHFGQKFLYHYPKLD